MAKLTSYNPSFQLFVLQHVGFNLLVSSSDLGFRQPFGTGGTEQEARGQELLEGDTAAP